MNTGQKKQVQEKLITFLDSYENAQRAVDTLKNVSYATIISMRDNKWDNISPEMWRNVGVQVGWHATNRTDEVVVETQDFKTQIYYFNLAKEDGEFFSIVGDTGSGKTTTGKWYVNKMKGKNVYRILCAEYWSPNHFLEEIIKAMGKKCVGTANEMMNYIITEVRKKNTPLFIFDEADKLNDKCLRFFITFENQLHKMCGIVWTATPNIKRRIDRGIRYNKMGYAELNSRIGSKHIPLRGTSKKEVHDICVAKGVTELEDINEVLNTYEGDLRRVDRLILKKKVEKTFPKK